jgi:hypothetical protein
LLQRKNRYAILKVQKGTTAHKVVDLMIWIELPPFRWSKFWGGLSMPKALVTNQMNIRKLAYCRI